MERHPELLALLDRCTPACEPIDVAWMQPLRLTVYVGPQALPEELVVSIRVLVRVGDDVVVCTNVEGRSHAWPGGRREPGETYVETACREVHEETGWILEPETVEPLGWMHIHSFGDAVPPFPHPDAVHLVVTARANERAADDWTDTEGFELSSTLVPVDEACAAISADEPMCVPFLELLRARA